MRRCTLLAALFWLALPARESSALAIVNVSPSASVVGVGEQFTVDIYGSLGEPVLGFGLDLGYDLGVRLVAPPEIGPSWLAVASLDGDGLAGLAPPQGIVGDVLLARLQFEALAPGGGFVVFVTDATPGDLSEGFALLPVGFETSVQFGSASVEIVPEPASPIPLALLILVARRLTRSTPRAP